MAALVSNTPNDVKITMLNCLAACPGNFAVFMLGFGEKGCLESVLELLGRGEEEVRKELLRGAKRRTGNALIPRVTARSEATSINE